MPKSICRNCGQKVILSKNVSITSSVEDGVKYNYDFYPCCNYFVQNPRVSMSKLNNLYDSSYHVFNQKSFHYIIYCMSLRFKIISFRSLIRHKSVLEIGSGTGEFLHFSKLMSPESIEGVEISKYAAKYAMDTYKLETHIGDIKSFSSKKKFDTIFMFHVIEHLANPGEIVDICYSLLKEKGTLVIETPNCDSFEADFYKSSWPNWSAPFHLQVYSSNALATLLERRKLRIVKVKHHIFSNTYSFLIPFLKSKYVVDIWIGLIIKFLTSGLYYSLRNRGGVMTIIAKRI